MSRRIDSKIILVLLVALILQCSPSLETPPSLDDPSNATARRIATLADLPLSFETNGGQADRRARFIARASGCNIALTDYGASLALSGERVNMKLIGAGAAQLLGEGEMSATASYFLGNDPAKWRADVPLYSKVRYEEIYRGIDLIYYGHGQELEYDFIVAPGADFRAIRFRFEGAEKVRLSDGELVIETRSGEIRNRKPVAYQEADCERKEVEVAYALDSRGEISFRVGEYDSTRHLVIDPILTFSTYLGGSNEDTIEDIAVDALGNIYVTGRTLSLDFPVANPLQPRLDQLGYDAVVAKLSKSGSLIYSAYFGGSGDDLGHAVAVDLSGNAYVTGETTSFDFPTTFGAFQTRRPGGLLDAFVAKIDSSGRGLFYSTYLGGTSTRFPNEINKGVDAGLGIAVDSSGSVYVTGKTNSESFPLKHPLQRNLNLGVNPVFQAAAFPPPLPRILFDAFVSKLEPEGTGLVYSTYLGGIKDDFARDIAIDESGSVYIAGVTSSTSFPVPAAPQSLYGGGGTDAFVARIKPSGRELVFSTFLGGAGEDLARGIALDSAGNAYIAGETNASDFPVSEGCFQSAIGGSPLYRSTDGGMTWGDFRNEFPSGALTALAVDPKTPTTIYAGVSGRPESGTYKSEDGGLRWRRLDLSSFALSIIIDPVNTSNVYARVKEDFDLPFFSGPSGRIVKSTDGGNSWKLINPVPTGLNATILDLAISPSSPDTLYAGIDDCPAVPQSAMSNNKPSEAVARRRHLYRSTDRGETWRTLELMSFCAASRVHIDPRNPSVIYAFGDNAAKSTDGGETWTELNAPGGFLRILAIDPVNTSVIYAQSGFAGNLIKSTDAGATWREIQLPQTRVTSFALDPINPSIIFAGYTRPSAVDAGSVSGRLIRSTDGGETWSDAGLSGAVMNLLAIDPKTPTTIYAGALEDKDAFVTEIAATGFVFAYSTYLGGRGRDLATSIAVDARSNVYVTGYTYSENFPAREALQSRSSDVFHSSAFVSKIDPRGQTLSYSTYLGGSSSDQAFAIALDSSNKVYVAGRSESADFPTVSPAQASNAGKGDAFIARISTPGKIRGASIRGKKLFVEGEGFDAGAVILIDGEEQKTANKRENPSGLLVSKKAAGKIAPGQTVMLQVRNSDSALSEPFRFTRAQ
ncbi:MAG: SBBP repeat-containing protein [Acidobacteriota bacterium]